MTFSVDQKIEAIKIIVGLIIAIVGGMWTYTTFTQDQRKTELNTLIDLGASIAGMNVTCMINYLALSNLANETTDQKKHNCYLYFEDAYKKSIAAQILIKKPFLYNEKKWRDHWRELINQMLLSASSKYIYEDVNSAWNSILSAKGLKH